MFVQEIKPIDKRRSRVVFENEETLVLYNGELRQFCIEVGIELSEEKYHLEIIPKLKKRIRERIVYILKARDKTEKELEDKLKRAGYPREVVEYGLSWAKKHGFINDVRYLEFYVESKARNTGKRKLRYDLKAKGFSEEDIHHALECITIDEETQIMNLLKKKRYFEEEVSEEKRQKILASVLRKGYSYSEVVKCMRTKDNMDFDEWKFTGM